MHISSSLAVLLLLAMTLPPWAAQAANVTLNDLNVGLASVKIPMAGGFGAGAPYYFYYKTVRLGPDSIVHMKADFASGGVLGNGWVGFGLAGPNSQMAGGVAVIGCQDSSYPAVGLYALSGTSLSNVQLVPGTLAQLGFFNASFTAGAANSTLEVYFNQTAGAAHLVLVPGWAAPAGGNGSAAAASEGVTMIFADGNSLSFSEHAHRTAFALDLVNAGALSQTRELDKALAGHIVFALAAFAFLFPAGASFALCHTRGGPSGAWFKWHRGIQVLGGVCALLCLALGLYHVTALGGTHLSRPHHVVGVAACACVGVQLANGFLRPHVPPAGEKPSARRVQWYFLHRVTAWGVLVLGLVNLYLGPDIFFTVFLGPATTYSIAGMAFAALNLEYFTYAVAAAALALVAATQAYGNFVRKPFAQVAASADFVTGTSGVSAPMPGDTPNPKYALAHMKI